MLAVVALAITGGVALSPRPDLTVLCSNNLDSCEAVADSFSARSGHRVKILRVSTSQALERLKGAGKSSEFDVWIGGPTHAYATAEAAGLLEPLPDLPAGPSATNSWFEVYGGILSLCVAADHDVRSWEELATRPLRIAAPSPLTSGTAATFLALQHMRLPDATPYLRGVDARVVTYTDSGMAPARLVATGFADVGITFAPYCDAARARGAAVRTVFPSEGTDYEVGGAAVLAGSPRRDIAISFLKFALSAHGQHVSAEAAFQAPIASTRQPTLYEQLDGLAVPVLHTDPYLLSETLTGLVEQWEREVYHARP
ncbi:extracellular solute-binding protein [Trueperella bialowiezensis]|uniref:extracellular solute-binding protein n=1 Tax=Trueperella bialowiezensis TaxID=312285 RepID=UPI0013E0179F|nr:extracellular solute-binding protein [Trueperella bialowiezensis]